MDLNIYIQINSYCICYMSVAIDDNISYGRAVMFNARFKHDADYLQNIHIYCLLLR